MKARSLIRIARFRPGTANDQGLWLRCETCYSEDEPLVLREREVAVLRRRIKARTAPDLRPRAQPRTTRLRTSGESRGALVSSDFKPSWN